MLKTKLLALSGLLLTLGSLLLGPGYWGYQKAVLLMQGGGLAFAFGLFFRLTGSEDQRMNPLSLLYDMESGFRATSGR